VDQAGRNTSNVRASGSISQTCRTLSRAYTGNLMARSNATVEGDNTSHTQSGPSEPFLPHVLSLTSQGTSRVLPSQVALAESGVQEALPLAPSSPSRTLKPG
jgi:hypothetical protein